MTQPVQNENMFYENDTFSIHFELYEKYIGFTIHNKSTEGIKINWDEVSISINGNSYRVAHKETGILKINEVQPPTTIPPGSNLEDFLVPTNNISVNQPVYLNGRSFTDVADMFPKNDRDLAARKKFILSLKGTTITVFMPFFIRSIYISHYYNLVINDVYKIKK